MLTRRSFFGVFGLLGLPGPSRPEPAPHHRVRLIVTTINGLVYYDGTRRRIAGLRPGERLVLRREPTNPYDERAIEVWTRQGYKLGYLPRRINAVPAALADQQWELSAEVAGVDVERWPYDCISIMVWGQPV